MPGQRACVIVHREGQVDLVVPEVIRLLAVAEPSELEPMRRPFVAEEDEMKLPSPASRRVTSGEPSAVL
jgi:hypothetical protein